MGVCNLCGDTPDDADLLEHLRVIHPDDYGDGPTRWPDGRIVVVDQTADTIADILGGEH